MNQLKLLSLAAVAAMGLISFASTDTASATVLKSSGSTLGAGAQIETSLTAGSSSYFKTTGGSTLNTCTSGSLSGSISNAGGSTSTVHISGWSTSHSGCVATIHTLKVGTWEFHHIAGTTSTTVTFSGFVLSLTIFGTSCLYETGAAKDVGTLIGGTLAKLEVATTLTEAEPKKAICPDQAVWTAEYAVTNPSNLTAEAS